MGNNTSYPGCQRSTRSPSRRPAEGWQNERSTRSERNERTTTSLISFVSCCSLVLSAFGRPSGWGAYSPLAPRVISQQKTNPNTIICIPRLCVRLGHWVHQHNFDSSFKENRRPPDCKNGFDDLKPQKTFTNTNAVFTRYSTTTSYYILTNFKA